MSGGGRAREEAWSWVPWSLSSLVGSVFSPPPRPPQKSQKLLTRDPGEGQASKTQNGRLQQHTARLTQKEPAVAVATGTEQASRKAKEFKDLAATHSVGSGSHAESQSFADKNLPPLTPRQLSAFRDIFQLFSSGRTGAVGMRSLRAALCTAGIQLSPQEMREALQQADLDGDGTVGFKDFLGVFTNSHHLTQCSDQVRGSQVWDPQGLQTLFLEMLFKLTRQGFVPYKSVREVMSYYSKKQGTLLLTPGCRGRSQGQGYTELSHRGLNFYCQAVRISGLSHAQLASLLHRLHKAGAPLGGAGGTRGRGTLTQAPFSGPALPFSPTGFPTSGSCSPYSQIPKLAPSSEVRFPKSYTSSHPWPRTNQKQCNQGGRFSDQALEDTRRWKMAPSPPTLVQKQPISPSPACLQTPAMKHLDK
ncbi:uncharacterized protein [Desmodus rotundus]|uniref:uncharacterized protein isoform X2 n=1 Tax=Desmodus rotundus TaxID=9430 RepID=UPI0023819341|nr:uncharacterized protein LOC112298880 isoform X2 [Desmodus rotundus]